MQTPGVNVTRFSQNATGVSRCVLFVFARRRRPLSEISRRTRPPPAADRRGFEPKVIYIVPLAGHRVKKREQDLSSGTNNIVHLLAHYFIVALSPLPTGRSKYPRISRDCHKYITRTFSSLRIKITVHLHEAEHPFTCDAKDETCKTFIAEIQKTISPSGLVRVLYLKRSLFVSGRVLDILRIYVQYRCWMRIFPEIN